MLRDDHAGTIEQVDTTLVRLLLDAGYLPVMTPPALALEEGRRSTSTGTSFRSSWRSSSARKRLFFFSDTPGLLPTRMTSRP